MDKIPGLLGEFKLFFFLKKVRFVGWLVHACMSVQHVGAMLSVGVKEQPRC